MQKEIPPPPPSPPMPNLRLVGPRLEKKIKHRGNPTFNREDIVGMDLNIGQCRGGNLAYPPLDLSGPWHEKKTCIEVGNITTTIWTHFCGYGPKRHPQLERLVMVREEVMHACITGIFTFKSRTCSCGYRPKRYEIISGCRSLQDLTRYSWRVICSGKNGLVWGKTFCDDVDIFVGNVPQLREGPQ